MSSSTIDAVAEALRVSLEQGEPDVVISHLAPRAVLWHNYDRIAMDAKQGMQASRQLQQLVADVSLEITSREATRRGFVQQFVLRGSVRSSGKPIEAHNCIVVTLEGGKITRIDEYVDPALLAAFAS